MKMICCAPLCLAAILLVPARSLAETAFVQSASAAAFGSGPVNTVRFTQRVTPGNLIAVYISWTNSSDTLVSVTDNLGNSYALVQNPVTLGGQARAAGAYAKNIIGGECVITATFSPASFSARTMIAHEVRGADPVDPLDAAMALGQTNPGTSLDAVTSGSAAAFSDGDYIFAATTDQGQGSALVAGTGFVRRESLGYPVVALSADRIQPSAGSIEATFTNTAAPFADFVTLVMAFKPVAVPDRTTPTVSMTGPAATSSVSGTIMLSATASDDLRMAGVQFRVNGANLGTESLAAPYTTAWNTAMWTNGDHQLTAVARDAFGNTTESEPVRVTIHNISTSQAILEPKRTIEWSQAGVAGGVPNRSTVCAEFQPGATGAAISEALTRCTNGVVLLHPGVFTLSGITFRGANHVTLRGAGPSQTILRFTEPDPCGGLWTNVCVRGTSDIWSGNVPTTNIREWTSLYERGSTQIELDSTVGLRVGAILVLDQLDDESDPADVLVTDASGYAIEGGTPGRQLRSQQQLVQVVAVNGRIVTISPGLYMSNWRQSRRPQAWWADNVAVMNGIEDVTLDNRNSSETSGVAFYNVHNGWMRNVRSLHGNRSHVWLFQSARIEVRDSYFYGTNREASQSYGVELFMTSDDLVLNNIFERVTTPLMTGPSSGAVCSYNFVTDMSYYVPTWMVAGIVGSHDAGTALNLFEGNAANQFSMDTYHGTGNLATVFRNRLTGTEPGKVQGNTIPVNIWGYNRFANVIGNVLGTPEYHRVYEDSSVGTPGSPERSIYVLGYSGVLESNVNGMSYDPLVVSTMVRWGNFDYVTNQTRWNPAEIPSGVPVPPQSGLPPSLFLFSQPGWWGSSTPWPAIGPDVAGGSDPAGHAHKIPAQLCYESTPRDSEGLLTFNAATCYPPR